MAVFICVTFNECNSRLTVVRGYSLLQNLAVCGLRIAEVHQLIHQLVYDDKVISNALFLQFFEVF